MLTLFLICCWQNVDHIIDLLLTKCPPDSRFDANKCPPDYWFVVDKMSTSKTCADSIPLHPSFQLQYQATMRPLRWWVFILNMMMCHWLIIDIYLDCDDYINIRQPCDHSDGEECDIIQQQKSKSSIFYAGQRFAVLGRDSFDVNKLKDYYSIPVIGAFLFQFNH